MSKNPEILNKSKLAFKEENESLSKLEDALNIAISSKEEEYNTLDNKISRFRTYDYDDIDRKKLLIQDRDKIEKKINTLRTYKPNPYFGHMDLMIDGEVARSFFIGENALQNSFVDNSSIINWRDPVGSHFYNKTQLAFSYNGHTYELLLRRSVEIKNAKLKKVHTEYDSTDSTFNGNVVDPFLISILQDKRREYKLTDIIRTIQESQNEIMQLPLDANFIVQGCAGSGKTMILLHRLSVLAFNNKDVDFSRFTILTPNNFFNENIDELSEQLGLDKIKKVTSEDYYSYLVGRLSYLDTYIKQTDSRAIETPKIAPLAISESDESGLNNDYLKEIYSVEFLEVMRHDLEEKFNEFRIKLSIIDSFSLFEEANSNSNFSESVYSLYKEVSRICRELKREEQSLLEEIATLKETLYQQSEKLNRETEFKSQANNVFNAAINTLNRYCLDLNLNLNNEQKDSSLKIDALNQEKETLESSLSVTSDDLEKILQKINAHETELAELIKKSVSDEKEELDAKIFQLENELRECYESSDSYALRDFISKNNTILATHEQCITQLSQLKEEKQKRETALREIYQSISSVEEISAKEEQLSKKLNEANTKEEIEDLLTDDSYAIFINSSATVLGKIIVDKILKISHLEKKKESLEGEKRLIESALSNQGLFHLRKRNALKRQSEEIDTQVSELNGIITQLNTECEINKQFLENELILAIQKAQEIADSQVKVIDSLNRKKINLESELKSFNCAIELIGKKIKFYEELDALSKKSLNNRDYANKQNKLKADSSQYAELLLQKEKEEDKIVQILQEIEQEKDKLESLSRHCKITKDFLAIAKTANWNELISELSKESLLQFDEIRAFKETLDALSSAEKSHLRNPLKIEQLNEEYSEQLLTLNELSRKAESAQYVSEVVDLLKTIDVRTLVKNLVEKLIEIRKNHEVDLGNATYRHQLYIQLVFCAFYYGQISKPDTCICVDEAQDYSEAEYIVIKHILGKESTFNLYGDLNQLIRDYRGISNWNTVASALNTKLYYLNQNYRNALPITNYCNKAFNTDIDAIGLAGNEVKELSFNSAIEAIERISKATPEARCAIIHKLNSGDIRALLSDCLAGKTSFNEINPGKISVLAVKDAKGLEFDAVVVLTDSMNNNELYIAYTRALDNLFITNIEGVKTEPLSIKPTKAIVNNLEINKETEPEPETAAESISEPASEAPESEEIIFKPAKTAHSIVALGLSKETRRFLMRQKIKTQAALAATSIDYLVSHGATSSIMEEISPYLNETPINKTAKDKQEKIILPKESIEQKESQKFPSFIPFTHYELSEFQSPEKTSATEILDFDDFLLKLDSLVNTLPLYTNEPVAVHSNNKRALRNLALTTFKEFEKTSKLKNDSPAISNELLIATKNLIMDLSTFVVIPPAYAKKLIEDYGQVAVETLKQAILTSLICKILTKNPWGLTSDEVIENVSFYNAEITTSEITFTLVTLKNQTRIFHSNKLWTMSFLPIEDKINSLDIDKEQKSLLIDAAKGSNLKNATSSYNFSSKTARILSETYLTQELLSETRAEEYLNILSKYQLSQKELCDGLGATTNEWRMAEIALGNKERTALPASELLFNRNIPERVRRKLEKVIYRNHIKIDNTYIKKRPLDLLVYCLKENGSIDAIDKNSLIKLYKELLNKIGLTSKEYELKTKELNLLDEIPWTIKSEGEKYRYYDIEENNISELVKALDFEKYSNKEITTKVLIEDKQELIRDYDLHNHFELYSALKTYSDMASLLTISLPYKISDTELLLTIGEPNRKEQVESLLLELCPISVEEFIKAFEEEYGFTEEQFNTLFSRYIKPYSLNRVLNIEQNKLTVTELNKLSSLLPKDFYTRSTLESIFKKNFSKKMKALNAETLEKTGFVTYSEGILRSSWHSQNEYFDTLIFGGLFFNKKDTDIEVVSSRAFTRYINDLEKKLEILPYEEDEWITPKGLKELGISKKMLRDFAEKAVSFCRTHAITFCSRRSLENQGFTHKLFEYEMEDDFYMSILCSNKSPFVSVICGKKIVACLNSKKALCAWFIENQVQENESIEIDELIDNIKKDHGIELSRKRILLAASKTTLYYSKITDMIYKNKEQFIREVE